MWQHSSHLDSLTHNHLNPKFPNTNLFNVHTYRQSHELQIVNALHSFSPVKSITLLFASIDIDATQNSSRTLTTSSIRRAVPHTPNPTYNYLNKSKLVCNLTITIGYIYSGKLVVVPLAP